jgi:hypothetical protein
VKVPLNEPAFATFIPLRIASQQKNKQASERHRMSFVGIHLQKMQTVAEACRALQQIFEALTAPVGVPSALIPARRSPQSRNRPFLFR